jgi:hypothetical protein
MHRTKSRPLAEQLRTLDEATAPAEPAEPLQLLDEPERPAIEWPAVERRKRAMPLTIGLVFLVLASLCFILAAFNATLSARVNLIGLGLFFWTLSLIVRTS